MATDIESARYRDASATEIADALERLVASRRSANPSPPGAPRHTGRRLGTLLVLRGFLVQNELDAALAHQAATGERLGEIVVRKGYISEHDLLELLAEQMRMTTIDLSRVTPDPSVVGSLSREYARRLQAVPVRRRGQSIDVAVADPTDAHLMTALTVALRAPVTFYLAPLADIDAAINRLFI